MINIQQYIEGGNVCHSRIAMDIKHFKLTREDVNQVVSNEIVKKSFFCNTFFKESDKSKWTQTYLDKLSCASIAEVFNEEYLYHLFDVAEFISQNRIKSQRLKRIVTLLLCAIIIFLIYMMRCLSTQ